MQIPQNYIIIDNKDGTYSAYVNYGTFESMEDAEKNLELVMSLMGMQISKQRTVH